MNKLKFSELSYVELSLALKDTRRMLKRDLIDSYTTNEIQVQEDQRRIELLSNLETAISWKIDQLIYDLSTDTDIELYLVRNQLSEKEQELCSGFYKSATEKGMDIFDICSIVDSTFKSAEILKLSEDEIKGVFDALIRMTNK